MSNDIGDWYRSIPIISKYWFTGSVVFPLLGRLGLVNPMSLVLIPELLIHKFHIWRPFTAVLFYPISPQTGFHYLMNLYFLYNYSTQLETGLFMGRPADYAFALMFMWLLIVLLMDLMVMSVLYLWCTVNKDTIVRFWFGTQFKAIYLPWILFLFNFILRGSGFDQLVGIFVGHLYYFIAFKYPQEFGGRTLLSTPQFMYRFLPSNVGGVHGFGRPSQNARRDEPQRHNWGRGNRM